MGNLVLMMAAAVLGLLAVCTVTAYFFFYKSAVNKKLSRPDLNRRTPLWSPQKVCIAAVMLALVLFSGICAVYGFSNQNQAVDDRYKNAVYDARIVSPEEMAAGYLSRYTIEGNPGYEKQVEIIEDVQYTYFVSKEENDIFHPAFLIFAEYIGEDTPQYYDADVAFQTLDEEAVWGRTVGQGEAEPYLLIVGNTSADCQFSCIVDFYRENKESLDLEALHEQNTALTLSVFGQHAPQ